MAFPLLYWRVRLFVSGTVTALEKQLAITFAIGSEAVLAWLFVLVLPPKSSKINELIAIGAIPAMLAVGLWLVLRGRARGVSASALLTVAMLVPYATNCALCLIGFFRENNDVGYYVAIPVLIIAMVEILFLCMPEFTRSGR